MLKRFITVFTCIFLLCVGLAAPRRGAGGVGAAGACLGRRALLRESRDGPAGSILHSMLGVYAAFDRARELARGGPIVPGHGPAVPDRLGLPPIPGQSAEVTRLAWSLGS